MKIRLLFKDTRFLPSGSDISDTCLRHSHLHESHAYYIAPTCWLPRDLSSSVAGNKSKLLLLVMCHPASAIIYVHRTIVLWPRGYFVCLRFQLYDANSGEPPPVPSEPKPGTCREALLQMNVYLPSPNWICEMHRETHGLPVDRVREGYVWTKRKESDWDGLHLWGAHPEGHVPHYSCWREVSFCQHALLCVLHLQQVREGGRSLWHDLQWSEHVWNRWRLGAEPMPKREKHMPRNQPWNATWHQLDWACREPQ